MAKPRDDQVFVKDGRRHHRPVYSRTEFRLGIGIVAILAGIASWIAWRGRNPDPELFQSGEALLGAPDATSPGAAGGGGTTASADRGPLPEDLAGEGWREGPVSTFGWDNLYVKIDGREDYYKTFGFRQLWFVSIAREDDPATTVDLELYDLGTKENALGAYAGERPEGIVAEPFPGGLGHLDRNALLCTRGPLYLRAIGSEESPEVRAQLERVRDAFGAGAESAGPETDLPRPYALFTEGLGVAAGDVAYTAENAFSFGFAQEVYSTRLSDDSEIFAVESGDAAARLAQQFRDGFREYGEAAGTAEAVEWTSDRYLHTLAGAKAVDGWTIGVKDAPDLEAAKAHLARLETAVKSLANGADR
ncbi:MAG: DUF6599 family protein [bacterium]